MSADADESDTSASQESDADPRPFPTPPRDFTDSEGRAVRLRSGAEPPDECGPSDERESLAAMYDAFGTSDRAQGIPPANPRRREAWLDRISTGVTVVAWHGDRAVGHGVLLEGRDDYELALFVHPEYRRAGVGSAVLRTLLGHGRSAGVERVWLSVQRTNRPAVYLYRQVGFRRTGAAAEMEMALKMRRSLR